MDVVQIPFVSLVGVEQGGDNLFLDFSEDLQNHVQTLHASAQFTLAETQSGLHLQQLFPELEGKVVPVLRDSQIKFKKPATKKVTAYASCNDEAKQKFSEQLEKKGRGSISIDVEIKDSDEVVTTQATFSWFVQKL